MEDDRCSEENGRKNRKDRIHGRLGPQLTKPKKRPVVLGQTLNVSNGLLLSARESLLLIQSEHSAPISTSGL